jgi:hypothetical protein
MLSDMTPVTGTEVAVCAVVAVPLKGGDVLGVEVGAPLTE